MAEEGNDSTWFQCGALLHGPFKSVCRSGANPEKTLRIRRGACKSNTATSEPCSPVFKEAQPRPSSQKNIEEHSNLEYHVNNLNLYLYVFGLFII